jgi:hypothetical protein
MSGSTQPPAPHEATHWAQRVTETLHGFERPGGQLPLFVMVVMDRSGHVLEVAAFDAEDYDS